MTNSKAVKNSSAKSDSVVVSREMLAKYSESIEKLEEQIEVLKKREKALNRLTNLLEKRNLRLEELNQIKDEFIGIASHQLRTPATGVKQYINLLLDGFAEELEPGQKVFLERAQESNDRQLRIIDDLLQVARIDSESFKLQREKVDLVKLIELTIEQFKHKTELHHRRIEFTKPSKPISIEADAEKMKMVIENILDNAINYSDQDKKILIKLKRSKATINIQIIDQGVGIAKSDYSKLFQKFSRIPNSLSIEVGGTGLGLYWADKVVRMQSGSIDVDSMVGKGSTFTICLPDKSK